MSALLEALLKRALPAPRDTTPVIYQGFVVPKYLLDLYLQDQQQ